MAAKVENELIYFISGMWCSTCAKSIGETVKRLEGVNSAQVNYATKLLLVKTQPEFKSASSSLDQSIQDKVSHIGFGIKKQTQNWLQHFQEDLQNESENKITWVQIVAVWFLAMWSSMFGLASYLGGITEQEAYYLTLASASLGLPAVAIGAWPYAQSGLRALIYSRWLTLDFFIFTGAIAASSVTLYSLFTAVPTSYADSSSMILAVLLLTKKLENHLSNKATAKILFQIQPEQDQVLVLKKQNWTPATTDQVRAGDVIRIAANQTLPLDGRLQSTSAQVNNHLLSGEDTPLELKEGDEVFAGAIANSELLLQVTAPQGQRKIDEWAERALVSENHKSGLQNIFMKLEQRLVLLAFSGAFLIAGTYIYKGATLTQTVEAFFVGILIFCPCLFASILPLAKRFSHFALFDKGILLSRSEALLDLCAIEHFYFDKTGTLENVESQFVAYDHKDFILPYLKEISIRSQHIILRELKELDDLSSKTDVGHLRSQGLNATTQAHQIESLDDLNSYQLKSFNDSKPHQLTHFKEVPGQGLIAETLAGDQIILGRPSFLSAQGVILPAHPLLSHQTYVALNKSLIGYILLQKNFNAATKGFLKALLKLYPRLHIKILSGDSTPNAGAQYTALDSRIEYEGHLTPDAKATLIEPRSAFLGDGINDTIALAQAQVSLRLGQRITGLVPVDIYFSRPHLNQILGLLKYARKYRRILLQTGFAALFYNIIAISLALFGVFSPLGAVISMACSFSLMLLSVFRLQFFEEV